MTQALRSGIERKIDSLGRIVIPAEIRQTLGLSEGDVLDIEVRGGVIVLSPMSEQCALCGMPQRARA
jgi:AbrB family transcriptional regulator, transcriptional pleiotropic regulator of transition state genes